MTHCPSCGAPIGKTARCLFCATQLQTGPLPVGRLNIYVDQGYLPILWVDPRTGDATAYASPAGDLRRKLSA